MENAIKFVMQFYDVTEQEALQLYKDEIYSYLRLMERINETKLSGKRTASESSLEDACS